MDRASIFYRMVQLKLASGLMERSKELLVLQIEMELQTLVYIKMAF